MCAIEAIEASCYTQLAKDEFRHESFDLLVARAIEATYHTQLVKDEFRHESFDLTVAGLFFFCSSFWAVHARQGL